MAVLQPEGQRFAHTQNADGSYVSTCIRCLASVASAQKEKQLYSDESAHACDPVRVYQVSQGWIHPLRLWE